jgi:hypothetical protein
VAKPRLVLALYGIGRMPSSAAHHYYESVKLLRQVFDVSVVEIRNDIGQVNNQRSGEVNCLLSKEFYFESSIKVQDDFRGSEYREYYELSKNYPDVHGDGYASNSNLIQQLRMLHKLAGLVAEMQTDFVLCIRDDLKFDPKVLVKLANPNITLNCVATSVFHSNCGVCERLVFGDPITVSKLLTRLEMVPSFLSASPSLRYCHTKGLCGEWLMRFVVAHYSCKLICIPLFTARYRANGRYARELVTWRLKYIVHESPSLMGLLRYFKLIYDTFRQSTKPYQMPP